MLRMTTLTLAVFAVALLEPSGCPLLGPPFDNYTGTPRGTITTTAQAPDTAQPGDTVRLEATATAEVDGGAVSYAWLQTIGPGVSISSADQAVAAFVAPSLAAAQTLRFMVTAHNEAGAAGRAEVSVAVAADPHYNVGGATAGSGGTAPPSGPIANAGADQSVLPGALVRLDGSRSTGESLTYRWRQASGSSIALTNADKVVATFTAPAFAASADVFEFELLVTDAQNRAATDRTKVTIRDPNATPRVRIKTTMGDIVLELNRDKAPVTVSNFLQYVDESFYDGTLIHRVVPDFVVQGGGYLPGLQQKKPTHDPITNEGNNGLTNSRGTVAMARTNDPNSATSQFYINLKDNTTLDYGVNNPGYAVFGRVVAGMDVVDAIGKVQTESRNGFQDVPVTDVVVQSIKRDSFTASTGGASVSGP